MNNVSFSIKLEFMISPSQSNISIAIVVKSISDQYMKTIPRYVEVHQLLYVRQAVMNIFYCSTFKGGYVVLAPIA